MNLVLSGPVDDALGDRASAIAGAQDLVHLHDRAICLQVVETTPAVRLAIAALCDAARVDHAFVETSLGRPGIGLIVMDMDSTLITIECIDEIADFVGQKAGVAAITEATMRGEIADFAESLRRRVALLAGANAHVLHRVYEERLRLSPGADELIRVARQSGVKTMLVSGGFTYFTERLVGALHLDAGHANTLEIVDGKLTGRVIEPIVGAGEKAKLVQDAMDREGLDRRSVIVVGDGSNDIPMMGLVDHSVGYHAKPAVLKVARHAVRYGTLETIVDYFS